MTIYLYKKTHNKTGFKYLGKTESANPHRYQGSGTLWKPHIKKHGYDVTTEIIKECSTKEEARHWGLHYSRLWNIVDSPEWANLREEEGTGGGVGKNNPMFGKNHTDEVKKASSLRRAKTNAARRWYHNGVISKFLTACPAGWMPGRINQKPTTAGNRWYNNGSIAVNRKEKPNGDEWVSGMLPKKHK